jgi:hypothetical protein
MNKQKLIKKIYKDLDIDYPDPFFMATKYGVIETINYLCKNGVIQEKPKIVYEEIEEKVFQVTQ